jgi:hypothetical protein
VGYYANDVATDGTQLAVAGNEFAFGLGHVWTSTDGATWTEHTSNAGPSTMNAIHGDADGFVSVGDRLDEEGNSLPTIWHSADGEIVDRCDPASDERPGVAPGRRGACPAGATSRWAW